MPHPIRIGIGGWTYAPWRGTFFPDDLPQSKELAFASRALTAIEVNGTYYRTQKPATFAKWAKAVSDDFIFTLKSPRYVTARKELAATADQVTGFLNSGPEELGPKLGPINWQLLPTKQFDPGDLAAFLDLLPDQLNGLPLRHAIEARHPSFACDEFADLLRDREIAAVLGADAEYPEIDVATAPFAYLRLMGTQEGEEVGYTTKELDRWAKRLRKTAKSRDVFAFIISGHKVANPAAAAALLQRLKTSS